MTGPVGHSWRGFSPKPPYYCRNHRFRYLQIGAAPVPDDAITIRLAQPEDASAIAAIFNQGICDRIAALETEERTAGERVAGLASRDAYHAVYVAELDGKVVAWGSLNPFNPRPAYQ